MEKKVNLLGWKSSGVYYLSLSTGIIGISECIHSTCWMTLMILTALISVVAFGAHLYKSSGQGNRFIGLLDRYGWIPVCVVAIAYMMKYGRIYHSPFFIIPVAIGSILAPACWLRNGKDLMLKIFSVYILALIAFWVALHYIHIPLPVATISCIYYGSILLALAWMLFMLPKVFAKYDGINVGWFLMLGLGVLILDMILFQLIPFMSENIPFFTDIAWLK